ncbi:iron ABC transporter permease, partial [Alkalihalophilus lindianensis]|nr:iron ABC transporter permease [Alkalihalophilus lindianensis]
MKKRKALSGLTIVKILLYIFFGLFLLLPLFSVFLVSFTGQPMNILGALTNSNIMSSTIEKLKGFSLEHYKEIFTNKG